MGSLITTSFFDSPDLTSPQGLSSAGGLVIERFNQAADSAESNIALTFSLLDQLKNQDYSIDWTPTIFEQLDTGGIDAINIDEPTAPDINSNITVDPVNFTGNTPTFDGIDIDTEPPPGMNVADPGFNIPSAPTDEFPTFSTSAPALSTVDYPTVPDLNLPAVPALSSVTIPSPPDYNLPDFEGVQPTMDITPPEPVFSFIEAEYNSDVNTRLKSNLLDNLVNGGSGLPDATEQAIYDRATSRLADDEQRVYDEALEFWSSRGWNMPPGALAGALLEASNDILQARTDINNDILVQQSKLAQENTHFIITSSIEHERTLIGLHNNVQQRSFEVAKFVVEAAVMIYGIKVEAYKAQMEAYKALAQVYEARIRAEIGKAELYKAQIEGVKALVEVDKTRIEAYKAQVDGVRILIDLYQAEMEGARIKAEVDKTRIQAFGALVEAYKAQIGAVTAKYEAYRYQIEGEKAKADMYKAQVDAYTSQVQAYKARAEVDVARAQVAVEINRGHVEVYKAAIDRYAAETQAAIAQAETEVKIEELDVQVFDSEVKKYQAEIDAAVRSFAARVEEMKAQLDLSSKEAEMAMRATIANNEMLTESIRSAARVAGQLAAASMASVSASADISNRESRSDSTSTSASRSKADVDSSSYSHSWSEITTKQG